MAITGTVPEPRRLSSFGASSNPALTSAFARMVGKVKFETRIKELVENFPDLAILVEPLLIVRRALREQIVILHRRGTMHEVSSHVRLDLPFV
jgi:hypothetical protein